MVPVPSFAGVSVAFCRPASPQGFYTEPCFWQRELLSLLEPTVPWRPSLLFLLPPLLSKSPSQQPACQCVFIYGEGFSMGTEESKKGSKFPVVIKWGSWFGQTWIQSPVGQERDSGINGT